MHFISRSLLLIAVIAILGSCSSPDGSPALPEMNDERTSTLGGHQTWGIWQFTIDPVNEVVDYIPVRSGELHLNAVSLLEPPAGVLISIEGSPQFSAGTVTLDIGLTHPAAGMVNLAGFDVKGILIGNGSHALYDLPQVVYAGDQDIRLLNADGYTRWWNPLEFPVNEAVPYQGYVDGLLGVPNSEANFSATINPYKYYCDGLASDADISTINIANRGAFSAGSKNVRQYVIDFTPSGLVFNYSVDANWAPPTVPPPNTQVPDDFPPGANEPEPYRTVVHEISNTLTYNISTMEASGVLKLEIEVYDWFNANQDIVCGYSPTGEVFGTCNFWPVGGGENYSTYAIDTAPMEMNSADDFTLWISSECGFPSGYNGILPMEVQGIFNPYLVTVVEES